MDEPERREAHKFFAEWLTESPAGHPLADASALIRNAFAVASLRRHDLLDEEMVARGRTLVRQLGKGAETKYHAVEEFLVKADPDWDEETFHKELASYLDLLVALLRENDQMEDLR